MLVVITIIGMIMALVGPRVLNYLSESKAKAAKIQIESFSSALDLYYLDLGRYPTSNEGLTGLTRSNNQAGWNGPYLRGGVVPNDPWGHVYVYRSPARARPTISSRSDRTVRKAAVERQPTLSAAPAEEAAVREISMREASR